MDGCVAMTVYKVQLCTTSNEVLNNSRLVCVDCNMQWGLEATGGVAEEAAHEPGYDSIQ